MLPFGGLLPPYLHGVRQGRLLVVLVVVGEVMVAMVRSARHIRLHGEVLGVVEPRGRGDVVGGRGGRGIVSEVTERSHGRGGWEGRGS